MEILARYATRSEAEERAAFLRARGIATHITDATSLRLNTAHYGQHRALLWGLLEPQFEDARALLEDPDHEVANPLTETQMTKIESAGVTRARDTVFRYTMGIGLGLAVVLLAVAWVYAMWGA